MNRVFYTALTALILLLAWIAYEAARFSKAQTLDGMEATHAPERGDRGTWQPVGEPLARDCQLYELMGSAEGCEGNRVRMVCSGQVQP